MFAYLERDLRALDAVEERREDLAHRRVAPEVHRLAIQQLMGQRLVELQNFSGSNPMVWAVHILKRLASLRVINALPAAGRLENEVRIFESPCCKLRIVVFCCRADCA